MTDTYTKEFQPIASQIIDILLELPPGDPFWSKSCDSGQNDHHKTCTDLIEELQRITELLKHKHGVK